MRRITCMIVGLVLIVGPALSGPGHLHADSDHDTASGLHLDHVHHDSGHGGHHATSGPALEMTAGHDGDNAVAMDQAGFRATPKRTLPGLVASAGRIEPLRTASAEHFDHPGTKPRDPPFHSRPPGRAPPSRV